MHLPFLGLRGQISGLLARLGAVGPTPVGVRGRMAASFNEAVGIQGDTRPTSTNVEVLKPVYMNIHVYINMYSKRTPMF